MITGIESGARPRATLRDVAALAGVSFKTVSRVVNAEPGVSTDVKERVEHAIAQLAYRPNRGASLLRRHDGRSGVVAALLQDVGNPYSAALLRGLEDVARDQGALVLAASLDEQPEREVSLVANLVARRVDGLVLMPSTERQDYLMAEVQAGLPTVIVDRRPSGIDCDSVRVDNRAGAVTATNHLIRHGHRRIAAISDAVSIDTAAQRVEGFRLAMSQALLPVDPRHVVTGVRSAESAASVVTRLVRSAPAPTALFCCRNSISVGAIKALRAAGLSHQIAIVGFDDIPLADLISPGLSVISQNPSEMGVSIGELLFSRVRGGPSQGRHVVVEPHLIARGSGELRAQT